MVILNKIYTKTGDDGTTALGTGERRPKDDLRIEAYGTVDETNATIGIARAELSPEFAELDAMLAAIQNDLFDLGAELATPTTASRRTTSRSASCRRKSSGWSATSTRLNAGLAAASLLRPAGRQPRRGGAAPRPHHLPPRRAADGGADDAKEPERVGRPALDLHEPPFRLPLRRQPLREHEGRGDVLWVPGKNR